MVGSLPKSAANESPLKCEDSAADSSFVLQLRKSSAGSPEESTAGAVATMTVSVLIVNFCTLELTIEAVESALKEPEAVQVVVVDNGSADGSGLALFERYRACSRVLVICSPNNLGFGGGNNLAAEAATEPIFFLLNSDATFRAGCLKQLCSRLAENDDIGVLAPSVYVTSTGRLQRDSFGVFPTAFRILSQATKAKSDQTHPDFVSACALMIRRETFWSVGGFDTDIFMYFEDVLLCWAIRKTGLLVERHAPAAVDHRGGKSYRSERELKRDYFDAQRVFLQKINEPILTRLAVASLQWPMFRIRSLRQTENPRRTTKEMKETPAPRILHVVADGAVGGGSMVVLALVRDLIDAGWEVHLASNSASELLADATKAGATVHGFDFFAPSANLLVPAQLASLCKRIDPDVVHTHGSRALLLARSAVRLVPTVHTVHGYHFLHRRAGQRKVLGFVERIMTKRIERVIFVSEEDRRLSVAHRLVSPQTGTEVIHNGVSIRDSVYRQRPAVGRVQEIVYLSRLVHQKDPLLAVEIAKELVGEVRLTMIGGGDLEPEVRAMVESAHLDGHVSVMGSLPHDQTLERLRSCDAMLLTSRWEGLPIAALEAMALGIPVVAPRIGAMSELAPNGEALLVDGRNACAFAGAIRSLHDPSTRARIGEAGKRLVETRFTWQACRASYFALYQNVSNSAYLLHRW